MTVDNLCDLGLLFDVSDDGNAGRYLPTSPKFYREKILEEGVIWGNLLFRPVQHPREGLVIAFARGHHGRLRRRAFGI